MRWKMIGMCVVVAGLAAGCSSSGSHARTRDYDRGRSYSSSDRYTYVDNSWASLNTGMTKTQVISRLGNPNKKKQFNSGKGTWTYRNGGIVYFDRRGRVSSWKEPGYAYQTRTTRSYSVNTY